MNDPEVETDPAYIFTDEELWKIIELVTPIYNSEYTANTVPEKEKFLVIYLARKEVYYRLATSNAPLFPISADGGNIQKDKRFDHYLSLIGRTETDFQSAWSKFIASGTVETYESTAQGQHYTTRNYNLANKPVVSLTVSGVTFSSVNLDWTKFSVKKGLFRCYKIYLETEPIIDAYAKDPINPNLQAKLATYDIHRIKARLENLNPSTDYYVVVASIDRNGLYGYDQKTFTTLPVS